jgi:hypothetical protein
VPGFQPRTGCGPYLCSVRRCPMGIQKTRWVLGVVLAASAAAGCQVSKSANPLSPAIAGPIEGVVINAPNLLEPGQGWQIRMRDQPIRLMIRNGGTSGVRPLTYTFEVAADAAFNTIVFKRTGVTPGDEITTLQLPDTLPTGRTFWWRARGEDGANVSEYSKAASFVTITPVVLGPPNPVSPTGTITNTAPEFRVTSGTKSGPIQNTVYTLQVANDQGFSSIAAIFTVPESGSQTTIAQNYGFLNDKTYYWRVQAKDTGDSQAVSAWSSVKSFTTAAAAPAPEPVPGGGGGGDISKCGPPYKNSPITIIQCHRNAYPTNMSASQTVAFLKGVARDMNRANIPQGPFGILQKRSGHNCNGYSCDIICSGQGNNQKQWDVLIDGKYATWGTPMTAAGGARVDVCEIQ